MTRLKCHANLTTSAKTRRNAMTRNSTCKPERRELSAGVRQQKEFMELAFEHLSEFHNGIVGADGIHRYMERI